MEEKSPLLRFGGLLLVGLLLLLTVVGWRALQDQGNLDRTGVDRTPSSDEAAIQAAIGGTPQAAPAGAAAELAAAVVPVLTDESLAPDPIPFTLQGSKPDLSFERYVVERGDTPAGIAERFGIRPETLLGGNPLLSQESNLLQTGVELIILPIDGVLHDVEPGDTLESVANLYGVGTEEIITYSGNNLEFPFRLYPETQILVPGAVRKLFVWEPPDLSSVVGSTSREGSGVQPLVVGTGTFVQPVNSRNFTQYFWYGHPGLDIALSEGSPVFATDTGTVTFAGWNIYGYGNLIVVNHGNGYESFYGHLSAINVVPGQIVNQGNIIGAVGNTGNSSGPHVHFEIRLYNNQDDPCWHVGC